MKLEKIKSTRELDDKDNLQSLHYQTGARQLAPEKLSRCHKNLNQWSSQEAERQISNLLWCIR
uniref:Uncharacterized protein n=1 Tax=Romanomermis culicivorax TaxID=13658 RepID=A0A915IM73_ROMCU